MALNASITDKNKMVSKKDNIELEFEMTDHKPKIIRKQPKHVHEQDDFLDIMSMDNNNNNNNNKKCP